MATIKQIASSLNRKNLPVGSRALKSSVGNAFVKKAKKLGSIGSNKTMKGRFT